jgi:hypothetical protein
LSVVAFSGTLFGQKKLGWLRNRFMGERIRQIHFQSLIVQLPLVLAMAAEKAVDPNAKVHSSGITVDENCKGNEASATDRFLNDRQQRFEKFKNEFDGELQRRAKFNDTVDPAGTALWRLCKPRGRLETGKPVGIAVVF